MPRDCAISEEEAVKVIIKYFDYFQSNIPSHSDKVWDEISSSCNGLWTKKSWLTNIRGNRRNILSNARKQMGVEITTERSSFNIQNLDQTYEELDSTILAETTDLLEDDFFYTLPGEEIFNLYLSPDEWHQIKPIDDSDTNRTSNSLRPHIWTNIIAKVFWKQHRLPCAFSFKNSQVNISTERRFFLKITGKCRSEKCGNKFIGLGYDEPQSNVEYLIFVKTRNTVFEDHEDVRRYLNGGLRDDLGKQCMSEGCNNVLKKMASQNLKRGDLAQPIIPSLRALQHAKCEGVNKMLNIKNEDSSDPIKAIYNMQFDNEYLGSIHDVSYMPFFVMYGTSEQIAIFQKYCRILGNLSKVSIDATGSLVAKIDRPKGTKTAHIFLYAIVINFHQTIQSVYQMLTEAQDTDTIALWLNRFLKKANKKPKEVITDYSRALLSAVSLAFNKMSLSMYIGECFKMIMNEDNLINKNNSLTYLRVDVAHLIHLACRWKCWKKVQQSLIRDFFLRCLSLLVDCQTIEDFKVILEATFIIAFQPYSDTVIKINNMDITVNSTFKKLQRCIAYRQISIDKYVENSTSADVADEADIGNNQCMNEDNVPVENINNYINGFIKNSQTIITEGEEINAFYCPDFGNNLARLSKEFPLWTAVATPYITSHASSSSSEANFGDLKNAVLKNHKKNIRVDKFVRIHLRDVIGGTRKFDSNLLNFIQKRSRPQSPEKKQFQKKIKRGENQEQVDLNEKENWRNKAGIPLFHDINSDKDENEQFTISDNDYDGDDNDNNGNNNNDDNDEYNGNDNEDYDNDDNDVNYEEQQKSISDVIEVSDESEEDEKLKSCDIYDEKYNEQKEVQSKNLITHNKQQLTTKMYNQSKYFGKYPEILLHSSSYAGNTKNKIEKKIFLINGGISKGIKLKQTKFLTFIQNTCAFDSIASIMATAAIDNPSYFSMIENNSQHVDIFNFIQLLVTTGTTFSIEQERGRILYNLYCKTLKVHDYGQEIMTAKISCWDAARNLWVKLFENMPSAIKITICNNCKKSRKYEYPTISPSHHMIVERGFSSMESAIDIAKSKSIRCSCGGMTKEELNLNDQIYIELDVRKIDYLNKASDRGESCRIADIPKILCLREQLYKLVGIVAFLPGHFVGYCWRIKNSWELYNDLLKQKEAASEKKQIEPHGLIYIKVNNREEIDR